LIRLTEKIAGRTVCILLHGASIKGIPEHALNGKDWCYVSLNDFMFVEALMKKELEVVLITSEVEIVRKCVDVAVFLDRNPTNLFITTTWALGALMEKSNGFVKKYRNQIILVPRPPFLPIKDNVARPNSVTILFLTLADAGVKKIVVLGMDGCEYGKSIVEQKRTYINQELFDSHGNRKTAIMIDTMVFNKHFPELFKGKNCEILNCSPGSHITVIPQITHECLTEMS